MLMLNQLAGFGGGRRASASDPSFASVVALLHVDGTHGSTTVTDVRGHSMTAYGTAGIDTTQSVFGGASLFLSSGGTGYVSSAASADWNFGTGDFTIEGRVRFTATSGDRHLIGITSASNNASWSVFLNGGNTLVLATTAGSHNRSASWTPSTNAWYAWAVSKTGGNIYILVDGTVLSTTADSNSWGTSTDALYIGKEVARNNNAQHEGFMDEIRITKGVGRYSASYTPATAAFPDA